MWKSQASFYLTVIEKRNVPGSVNFCIVYTGNNKIIQ